MPGIPYERIICKAASSRDLKYVIEFKKDREEVAMTTVSVSLQPLIALIAGILILIIPRLLNLIVAVYLIIIGILGLVR